MTQHPPVDEDAIAFRRSCRPKVGAQIRRWRVDRQVTLARLSSQTGLNVGYLSQIENDKASPSLETLGALGEALEVPVAWFLIESTPPPRVVRRSQRLELRTLGGGRAERVDGGMSRDISIIQAYAKPGMRTGGHAHAGDEHHVVLSGRWRMQQGDHEIEAGPGDYIVWDAALPHDVELLGAEDGSMLIVSLHGPRAAPRPRSEA